MASTSGETVRYFDDTDIDLSDEPYGPEDPYNLNYSKNFKTQRKSKKANRRPIVLLRDRIELTIPSVKFVKTSGFSGKLYNNNNRYQTLKTFEDRSGARIEFAIKGIKTLIIVIGPKENRDKAVEEIVDYVGFNFVRVIQEVDEGVPYAQKYCSDCLDTDHPDKYVYQSMRID